MNLLQKNQLYNLETQCKMKMWALVKDFKIMKKEHQTKYRAFLSNSGAIVGPICVKPALVAKYFKTTA